MAGERTVDAVVRTACDRLEAAGIDAPRTQALALLGHALGLDRAALLARLREPLEPAVEDRFGALLERRLDHEPLQYLLGRAGFLDFELAVGPGVFIPRPETEGLVESALREWPTDRPHAIDLCSGSGAIAIALARARPEARVLAIELSPIAIPTARDNARALGVADRVRFVRSDLLSALKPWPELGLLVCNPPYAPRADVVQPEVRDHEPELAWSGGPGGLDVYRRLVGQAADRLPAGCPMLLELGWGQQESVPELLAADGRWERPELEPDFQGIPRVLVTRRGR